MNTKSDSSASGEHELTITRDFEAPRVLVWKAWTDSEWIKRWWGPKGFTAPVARIDFRVEGKYLYCMRSPDGKDYWSTGVFLEIVPLERIVATDSFADEKGNVVPATYYGMSPDFPLELRVTLTFEEKNGKTRSTLRYPDFPSGKDRVDAEIGWKETLDKLEEALAMGEAGSKEKPSSFPGMPYHSA